MGNISRAAGVQVGSTHLWHQGFTVTLLLGKLMGSWAPGSPLSCLWGCNHYCKALEQSESKGYICILEHWEKYTLLQVWSLHTFILIMIHILLCSWQLGLSLWVIWACGDHSFDFRIVHCPNYLYLNQDSSVNICAPFLFFFFFTIQPSLIKRYSKLQISRRDNMEKNKHFTLI